MVIGLDRMRSYFEGYEDKYIIIGGTACEIRLESRGVNFRGTQDIDMLLIIEATDKAFFEQFWRFISDGEYTENYIEPTERKFFRFKLPQAKDFPKIVELFSRKPDGIVLPEGFHLTPIPADEEISSLSAMLLDDNYYEFTIRHCGKIEGLIVADEIALICLKGKAYLNNKKRRDEGHDVRDVDIDKHKKDVLKLIATLPAVTVEDCPAEIKKDLSDYIGLIREENPDISGLVKEANLGEIGLVEILNQLSLVFGI